MNEKIKNYIIIGLGALLIIFSIGFFRTCGIHDYSGTDAGITKSITRAIRTAIYIAEVHTELVRISDQFRIDIERLRTENTGLESDIRELQTINGRLREYKSTLESTIRSIIDAGNGIAERVDNITGIIREVQEGTEKAQN